jgi:hypothetical protein
MPPAARMGISPAKSEGTAAERSHRFIRPCERGDCDEHSLLLIADGHDTKRAKPGARVDRAKLQQIDLHWHALRHEGACRLLADGVDIRTSS